MPATPITEKLKQLREEKGWSREVLSHHAYAIDPEGTSLAQITAIERGARRASARTILALAEALDVNPSTFPEFRLALARHALDERKVGLDKALRALERSGMEPLRVSAEDIRLHSHQGSGETAQSKAKATSRRARARRRS